MLRGGRCTVRSLILKQEQSMTHLFKSVAVRLIPGRAASSRAMMGGAYTAGHKTSNGRQRLKGSVWT